MFDFQSIEKNAVSAVVVGNKNSGKSVLLAAMFGTMQQQSRNRHEFHLFVDDAAQRNALQTKYKHLTNQEWLESTGSAVFDDISFTVKVDTPEGVTYPACRFNYIDYAGGFIAGLGTEDSTSSRDNYNLLQERALNADAIIGLIDGTNLREYLDPFSSEKQKIRSKMLIDQDIYRIVTFIKTYKSRNHAIAVQLVISKWDELDHCGISLEEAISVLHTTDSFTDFVQHIKRDTQSMIRIIPISAVGRLATQRVSSTKEGEPDTFNLIKRKEIKPYNIESLLSFLLHAKIKALYQESIKAENEVASSNTNVTPELDWWDKVSPFVHSFAQSFLGGLFSSRELEVIKAGRERKEMLAYMESQKLEEEKQRKLKEIDSGKKAFHHALDIFIGIQRGLEKEYPADLLYKVTSKQA